MVCFDYHQYCKGGSQSRVALCSSLLPLVQDFLAAHGYFKASGGLAERYSQEGGREGGRRKGGVSVI